MAMQAEICQLMLNTYQMCYPCPRTFVTYVPSLYRPQRAGWWNGDIRLIPRRIETNAHAVQMPTDADVP
jgi:hypothetical protein